MRPTAIEMAAAEKVRGAAPATVKLPVGLGSVCSGGTISVRLLGWTRDSRFVAYSTDEQCGEAGDDKKTNAINEGSQSAYVESVSGDTPTRYLLKGRPPEDYPDERPPEIPPLKKRPKAFAAWKRAHPLQRRGTGMISPDGATRLRFKIRVVPEPGGGTGTFTAARGSRSRIWEITFEPVGTTPKVKEVVWAPDGVHFAASLHLENDGGAGRAWAWVIVGRAPPP